MTDTKQVSLWQEEQQSNQFAELCSALYERELQRLALIETNNASAIQSKLKSLPYYVQKAAHEMISEARQAPLDLDTQTRLGLQNKPKRCL